MKKSEKLTNMQVELIKMFNYDLDENQLHDIKNLLSQYFAKKLTDEVDQLWEENNWDNQTIEKWSKEHMREKQ